MARLPEPAYSCQDFKRVLWNTAYDPVAPDPSRPSLAQAEIAFARRGREAVPTKAAGSHEVAQALKAFWSILGHLERMTAGLVTVSGGWPEDWQPATKAEAEKARRAQEQMQFLQSIPKELYDAVYPEALAEWEDEQGSEDAAPRRERARPFDPISSQTFWAVINSDFMAGGELKASKGEARGEELAHLDLPEGQPLRLGLLALVANATYLVDPDAFTKGQLDVLDAVARGYTNMFLKDFKDSDPETFEYVDTFMDALKEVQARLEKKKSEEFKPQESALSEEEQEWADQVASYRYVPGQEYARNEVKAYIDAQRFLERLEEMREMLRLSEAKEVGNPPRVTGHPDAEAVLDTCDFGSQLGVGSKGGLLDGENWITWEVTKHGRPHHDDVTESCFKHSTWSLKASHWFDGILSISAYGYPLFGREVQGVIHAFYGYRGSGSKIIVEHDDGTWEGSFQEYSQEARQAKDPEGTANPSFPWEAKLARARSASSEVLTEQQQVASLLGQYREQQAWMVRYLGRLYTPGSFRPEDPNAEAFFENVFKLACALEPLPQEFVDSWLSQEAEAAGKLAAFKARETAQREEAAVEEARHEYESKLAAREVLKQKEINKYIPPLRADNYLSVYHGQATARAKADIEKLVPNLTIVAVAHAPKFRFVPATPNDKGGHLARSFKTWAGQYLEALRAEKDGALDNMLQGFTAGLDAYLAGEWRESDSDSKFWKLAGVFGERFDRENPKT